MTSSNPVVIDPASTHGARIAQSLIGIGFLFIGVVLTSLVAYLLYVTGGEFYEGAFENHPIASLVLFIIMVVLVKPHRGGRASFDASYACCAYCG